MGLSYRILIVDDVPLLRTLAKNYFNRSEYQLTTAGSVAEALRMATAIRPHLIIMSAELLNQNGLVGCRQIKNHPALFTTPVILVANNESETLEQCWQAGCDAVLPRPLNRREMVALAQKLLVLGDRGTPRIEYKILVRYGTDDQLEWHDYAINVGNGGLFLATKNRLPVGTVLYLELLIPGVANATRCRGQVTWVNSAEKNLRPDLPTGVGIEFTELDSAVRKELQRFVLDAARKLPIASRRTSDPDGGE
ncbi:MAG: TIGR02266 family protein [Desulfuromonadales bacterium]|nr:TIGR02266 family protein [Desulfuromonadales bacterium]